MSDPLVPPHDIEAEIAVLGSMILDADATREVLKILTAADFYRGPHAELFRVLDEMAQDDEAIDAVLLRQRLEEKGLLNKIGGTSFLTRVMQTVPTSANAGHYARIVREEARKRAVIAAANAYAIEARNGTEEGAFEAFTLARKRLIEATGEQDSIAAASLRWDLATQLTLPAPPPPVMLVDRVFTRPTVNMVFGPPGSGKSFALLQTMLDLVCGGGSFLGHDEFQIRTDTSGRFDDTYEKCLWIFGSEDSRDRMDIRSRKVFNSGPHAGKSPLPDRFVYITPPDDIFLGDPRGWRWLDDVVTAEKPTVIVLDTVSSLISSSLDLTKHDHVATYLRHFHRYRDQRRIASFHVAHTRKASGDPKAMKETKADTMLGSQAWRGLSDGLLLVHASDGDTDHVDIRILKSKDLEHPIPHLLARLNRDIGRFEPRDPDEPDIAPVPSGRPKKCSTGAILDLRRTHPTGTIVWSQIHDLIGVSRSTWTHNYRAIQEDLLNLGHVVVNDRLVWNPHA